MCANFDVLHEIQPPVVLLNNVNISTKIWSFQFFVVTLQTQKQVEGYSPSV